MHPSIEKAVRSHEYITKKYNGFYKKHKSIIEEYENNKSDLTRINKYTYCQIKCSRCGKIYIISFAHYRERPLAFKDWICFDCEQELITNALLKISTKTSFGYGCYKLTYEDKSVFNIGLFSDGTINGINKRIVDRLGRLMYGVE